MLRIYFDNCCYSRPFDNQNDLIIQDETQAKMFIQSLVKYRAIELAYSSISVEEIRDMPSKENSRSILNFVENKAEFYVSKDNNENAVLLTEEIMRTGIKLKDASHTACAIIAKCDYLITTDKRLLKYKDSRIKIINPIEFIKIWRDI